MREAHCGDTLQVSCCCSSMQWSTWTSCRGEHAK